MSHKGPHLLRLRATQTFSPESLLRCLAFLFIGSGTHIKKSWDQECYRGLVMQVSGRASGAGPGSSTQNWFKKKKLTKSLPCHYSLWSTFVRTPISFSCLHEELVCYHSHHPNTDFKNQHQQKCIHLARTPQTVPAAEGVHVAASERHTFSECNNQKEILRCLIQHMFFGTNMYKI